MTDAAWIIGEIIIGLGFLGVLAAVITVWVTRALMKPSAADIVAERYARGEITRVQYEQMREDLGIAGRTPEQARAA